MAGADLSSGIIRHLLKYGALRLIHCQSSNISTTKYFAKRTEIKKRMEFIFLQDVDRLKKESFLEPDLYEELMQLDSEVERQRMALMARERAKQLGAVRQFDSMYRAIQSEIAKAKKEEEQNSLKSVGSCVTDFPSREFNDQFRCGDWTANKDGIFRHSEKGIQTACTHMIYPTRILRNAETGKYKIELEFMVRGKIRRTIVPREVIASPSKILALADDSVQVTSKTAPYLIEYLADIEARNDDIIKEYMSTSRLGWIDITNEDGTVVKRFLPYQQEAIFDNEIGVKSLYDSIKSCGSRDKWYGLVKEIRAKRQNEVLINLAASFASVLVEPCGALPFIVSLWGGTGIGKSVILKLCTSVWADPGEGKYITDAKATNTAMEIRLSILNSLPMTLDDMAQVKNQYDEDFSELIYRWCAGKGRDRSNKELGLNKLTNWRNCTITNGERSLVDESTQGGAVNRVIDIEASGDVLFDAIEGNRTVNIIDKNYGFAGRDFINVLEDIGIDAINPLMNKYCDLIKKAASDKDTEKEDKQIVPMALILAADELIETYLFKDGIRLDVNRCTDYLKNKGEVDENERTYRYLMEQIQINSRSFRDPDEDEDEDDDKLHRMPYENWGYFKDENYVVIFSAKFDEILAKGGFQSKSFLAWAKKKDLLELDKRGQPRKHVSHGKVRGIRAIVIKTDYGNEIPIDSGFVTSDMDEIPFND